MSAHDDLPFKHFITNQADYDRLVADLHDPDAERFRYMAAAMLDVKTPQAQALAATMQMRLPTTLEDVRACVDAAKRLVP